MDASTSFTLFCEDQGMKTKPVLRDGLRGMTFCRVNSVTRAMEAGFADHVWSMKELLLS
jgi:hypothetical protein